VSFTIIANFKVNAIPDYTLEQYVDRTVELSSLRQLARLFDLIRTVD
jgi:hypothetical protein